MDLVGRLLTQAQALAAVTARTRTADGAEPAHPAVAPHLDAVVDALGARATLDDLTPDERRIVVSFARSYFRQALDLMEEPSRAPGWTLSDAVVLGAQGSASGVVARLIQKSGLLADDAEARILDVGTGVAGLAIALCKTFPRATVVGVDPWEPSLALARANVEAAGLTDRIALHRTTIEAYADNEGFDLAWFPSFFIPESVIGPALARVRDLLKPNGQIAIGTFEAPDDPLAAAVDALATVRAGGAVELPAALVERLRRAGYVDVRVAERAWQAPVFLVLGRRGEGGATGPA